MPGVDQRDRRFHGSERQIHAAVSVDHVIDHPAWRTTQDSVLNALSTPGLVVLLGGEGTGKTLFLHVLARTLRQARRNVVLHRPGTNLGPLRPEILLVDDADRQSDQRLHTLAQHARHCVFAGQPSLRRRLAQRRQRLTTVTLAPLAPRAATLFLADILARSNLPADLLHPEAVAALLEATSGVPRRLETLTSLAAFMARLEDVPQVLPTHVGAALEKQSETTLHDDDFEAVPQSDGSFDNGWRVDQTDSAIHGDAESQAIRALRPDTAAMLRIPLSSHKHVSALQLVRAAFATLFGLRRHRRRALPKPRGNVSSRSKRR
jgi:hypothetical protein